MSAAVESNILSVIIDEHLTIPLGIRTLEDFRCWTRSDAFPERGRIDFVNGNVEVDMQAEAMFSHGGAKAAIVRVLSGLIWDEDLGEIRFDNMRVASKPGNLSSEPDVLFISHETFQSKRVNLIPKANREDEYVEIEGGPDMVAEIVSDASFTKDTQRLPASYFAAGVREYWLIDARGNEVVFIVHSRGETEFHPANIDAEGFQNSGVFSRRFRLTRIIGKHDHWKYDLEMRP